MSAVRGVLDANDWYVKSLPENVPWPLDSGLAPIFSDAKVETLPGALKFASAKYAEKECMATRKLIERQKEEVKGKVFEKLKLGEYSWKTYSEVQKSAEAIGSSLNAMNFKYGDRIAIFAETRNEWFTAAMGALQQRVSVCTVYTTLSDSGIVHALNETEVKLVFTSHELLGRFSRLLNQCPCIKTVVVFEDQLEGVGDTSKFPKSVSVVPYSEISRVDRIKSFSMNVQPDPEDIAIIMYTSGSTGTPKGVELTHRNILASVVAYSVQMNVGLEDRYLAFLPLAHIMELATEVALISLGVTIYYSSVHTLTSNSPKVMAGTKGDAKVAKPTLMNAVPLLLDRIIKGVTQAVEKQGWVKTMMFSSLVYYKFWLDYIPFTSTILDLLVFQKVKNELGGQLKRVVVGGAPLSPQTHDTFRAIFGVTLQVGYGCTETASCATGMNEDDYKTGHSGGPCLNVLLRLENWEEGNYRVTDKPYPRGEIIVGGVCVAKGYFKLPGESERAFFEKDGQHWFRTGDIGEIDNAGCIRIIDRKKDLVKLRHGEYISLGNAESVLKTLNVVDNMCIFADSTRDNVVAVVVPVTDVLRKIASGVGITDENISLEQLCEDERVKGAVLKELQMHGKRCSLSRWEIPAAVYLAKELWTPDTGLVTAALKLRRKQLNQQYQSMVLDMYSRLND